MGQCLHIMLGHGYRVDNDKGQRSSGHYNHCTNSLIIQSNAKSSVTIVAVYAVYMHAYYSYMHT